MIKKIILVTIIIFSCYVFLFTHWKTYMMLPISSWVDVNIYEETFGMLPDHLFCLNVPLKLEDFNKFIKNKGLEGMDSSKVTGFNCVSECWGSDFKIANANLFGLNVINYGSNIGVLALYQNGNLYYVSCDA